MNEPLIDYNRIFATRNILLFFFFLIYLFFPTSNSTADAYQYASSVKYGNNLFSAHHLFYNAFNYLTYEPLHALLPGIDALAFMKALNAVFATLNLLVLYKILMRIPGLQKNNILILLFFAGSSYGIMRFATEAEAYIIPIFFSLLGSYFYVRYSLHNTGAFFLFLSGFFAALACLFHQIHFFWWLGLFISLLQTRRLNAVLHYFLPAILVPLVYYLVLVNVLHEAGTPVNLFRFIFMTFTNGSVINSFGWNNLLLTCINFIRTFFQVHGKCLFLFRHYPLLGLSAAITFILVANSVFPLRKINQPFISSPFFRTHLGIFILQLLFAAYAVGNAEFMVMIPFLICFLIPSFSVNYTRILFIASAMLLWNLSFGIVPDAKINYTNDAAVLQKIDAEKNHHFILKNGLMLAGKYLYLHGSNSSNLEITSPAIVHQLHGLVREGIKTGNYVYTDLGKNTSVLSRGFLLEQGAYEKFFEKYTLRKVDSTPSYYGYSIIYAVSSLK